MTTPSPTKRIDPDAYNALAEALAVIYWNKQPWARYLRGLLHGAPEILSSVDLYNETKREATNQIVTRLMLNEHKYQGLTVSIMMSVARMTSFPNLESQSDRELLVPRAQAAVAELKRWTQRHQAIIDEQEKYAEQIATLAQTAAQGRAFSEHLARLKDKFLAWHTSANPQQRGRDFEGFINELFGLFDLEPRASYSLEREQIDGAFSFDTDDYVLEAKWWTSAMGRDHLDIFKTKINRKGKNALGLYISISGFTADALQEYSDSTPFITMDGGDLISVLDERVRLDDLIRRKKRHANETGHCYFPAARMLAEEV